MPIDPRAPVIVGAGQTVRRPSAGEDLAALSEPVDMMVDAARTAADDSASKHDLLGRLDVVEVVSVMSWHYSNPGALLAERLGSEKVVSEVSTTGGNSPQMLVNRAAAEISSGHADVVLVTGAEAMRTRTLAHAAEPRPRFDWTQQDPEGPLPSIVGDDRAGSNEAETAQSLVLPIQVYPLFENALRDARGETIADHRSRIARLWARFSDVAAKNPYAWSTVAKSAEEILTPGPDNRMISFPYTKLMTANLQVDQSSALLLCSAEAALRAGVPEDRWVFVHAGAEAHDHWFVSNRFDLHSSPAIRLAGRAGLGLAGIGIDDVGHVDLYSCFPSAVQIGATELGLGMSEADRELTVTGGLGFAGGPANNYSSHAIAAMVGALREDPGSLGLVTALGWFATKHAIGLYSTVPPLNGYRWKSVQQEVDALPSRDVAHPHEGPVTVETYTVTYERDGDPGLGIAACLLPDGRRAWGTVRDPALLREMTVEEQCGRKGVLGAGGRLELA